MSAIARMKRRRLLAHGGTLAVSLLAGCLGGENTTDPDGSTATRSPAPATVASNRTATNATPTATDRTDADSATPATDSPSSPASSSPSTPTTELPGETETEETTGTPPSGTTEPDTGSMGSVGIVERRLTVGDRGCGTTNEGTVAVENRRVLITGTIPGSDGCKTAVLDEATYDAASDRLRVVVGTDSADGATVCAQCLTGIEYEATIAFENGAPGRVVLVHRGVGGETEIRTETV